MEYVYESRFKPVLAAYKEMCEHDGRPINYTIAVFIDERQYICQVIRTMTKADGKDYKFKSKLTYVQTIFSKFQYKEYGDCVQEFRQQLRHELPGPSRVRAPMSEAAKARRAIQLAEYGKPPKSAIAKAVTKRIREDTLNFKREAAVQQ
jgi:hypothetical protein